MNLEKTCDAIRSLTSQAHTLAATVYSKKTDNRAAEALADLAQAEALLRQALAGIAHAKGLISD